LGASKRSIGWPTRAVRIALAVLEISATGIVRRS
jgi:hypothetical protein